VAALATAFAQRSAVEIDYEDREGARTRRTVEPHALLVQVPLWYLLAHDLSREAPRMFRVDRIRRAHALGDPIRSRLDLWSAFDLVLMGVRPR